MGLGEAVLRGWSWEGDEGEEETEVWAFPRFAGSGSPLHLLARKLAVGIPLRSLTRASAALSDSGLVDG